MGANSSEENDGPISAINVTPFVDVVLVLLVIFMVTAPMMMKDVLSINLPKASKADPKTLQTLGVAITAQGQVLLNGQLVSFEALSTEAKKAAANPDSQAIISADGEAKHADVVKVMDTLKSSGLNRLAIQVQRQ